MYVYHAGEGEVGKEWYCAAVDGIAGLDEGT